MCRVPSAEVHNGRSGERAACAVREDEVFGGGAGGGRVGVALKWILDKGGSDGEGGRAG